MRNHRLTLAAPPFTLAWGVGSIQESSLLSRRVGGHAKPKLSSSSFGSQTPAVDSEWLEIDLEGWLNAEHFSSNNLNQQSPSVALGLPKHSQPEDSIRLKRIQHQQLPPIAMVGSNSIAVGNLPIQFSWESKSGVVEEMVNEIQCAAQREDETPMRSIEQIVQSLNPPLIEQSLSAEVHVLKQGCKGRGVEKIDRLAAGPAHSGPSIEDLFSHLYISPAPRRPRPPPRPSGWVWIEAARVRDPSAERFQASVDSR